MMTTSERKFSSAGSLPLLSSLLSADGGGRRRRKLLFSPVLSALESYDPRKKHTIKFPLIIAVALPSKRNMSSTLTEEQKRDRVQQVIGMGFSEEQAVTALQMADYDVNRAADLIVQGGKSLS